MVTPSYTIVCTRKELVAPNVYELRFEKPAGLLFKPGQFLLFDVPLVQNPTDIQPRACSIASTTDEQDLLFVVKLKQGGRMSEWIVNILTVGQVITMKGPFGLFLLRPNDHNILFAATGAGIAPFRSQILHALKQGDKRAMHLFFGVRSIQDLFWHTEFESLQKRHSNFHLHLCFSGEHPNVAGEIGRIQKFLPHFIKKSESTDLYVCGAPDMVTDIKKMGLETLGLPKQNVHAEGYI
ncbi:hypothetical protein EXS65_03085 [Candidatus Peribacteria bacterium]|nr:hypothetical protein [Candidatus Peribacteria bacterium]